MLLAGAAANMVAAMEETGQRRLICVSAGGPWVRDDPNMNLLIKLVLPRVLATTFADIRGMEGTMRASGVDWTLVRASQLTNGPLTGRYRVAPGLHPARRAQDLPHRRGPLHRGHDDRRRVAEVCPAVAY